MDIVRFTAGASAGALAGITDGDRVVELGAASVAELLAEPAVALPAAKGRCAELAFPNLGVAGCQRRSTLARSAGGRVSYLPGGWDL
jgi:hypothetical protein